VHDQDAKLPQDLRNAVPPSMAKALALDDPQQTQQRAASAADAAVSEIGDHQSFPRLW
jgi:hypothetical protein